MEDRAQAGAGKFLIGVTGAQGVGKSTFCQALRNRLAEEGPVILLDGLGDRLKLAGVPLGRHSDAATIAAVFAAHLDRETEAGPGLAILDRCLVDALAYPRETQEMLFDAHARAFAFFGGVPTRGIYDNMKTAMTSVFTGKERVFNRRFLVMASHYMVEPTACSPAAGWEKGQVENQVQTGVIAECLSERTLRADG